MIARWNPPEPVGSRLAIVLNGSPLFTGDAGSGESNIRRWLIENDWLEAIIALPDQLFYNTGISTYIWIVTNCKRPARQGKIQLVDAITADRRQLASASAILNAAIDPAVARFRALPAEEQEEVRAWLTAFTRLYSFLLHVIPFADPELEKLHDYARFLLRKVPRPDTGGAIEADDYVALRYYRLTKTGEQHIALGEEREDYALTGPSAVGTGKPEENKKPLSALIEKLNEAFGLDLTVADQLSFDQIEENLVSDSTLTEQAQVNDPEHYAYGFAEAFDNAIVDRLRKNESIFTRLLDDAEFQQIVKEFVRPRVYQRQRTAGNSVTAITS